MTGASLVGMALGSQGHPLFKFGGSLRERFRLVGVREASFIGPNGGEAQAAGQYSKAECVSYFHIRFESRGWSEVEA